MAIFSNFRQWFIVDCCISLSFHLDTPISHPWVNYQCTGTASAEEKEHLCGARAHHVPSVHVLN